LVSACLHPRAVQQLQISEALIASGSLLPIFSLSERER
jgi:hypothetical protein